MPINIDLSAGPVQKDASASRDFTGEGSGKRVFYCLQSQLDGAGLPTPGSSKYSDDMTSAPAWMDNLICTNQTVLESWGTGTDGQPSHYVMEYSFRTLPELDGVWRYSMRGTSKFIERGYGREWVSDDAVSDMQAVIKVTGAQFTASKVCTTEEYNLATMLAAAGCVNDAGWTAPWGVTFPAETLLFDNPEFDPFPYPISTTQLVRVRFQYTFQPYSHNLVWRIPQANADGTPSGAGFWDTLKPDASGKKTFPPVDFVALFGGVEVV